MSKGFIIVTHFATADQQNKIRALLAGRAWWHQMPQVWLVADPGGTLNPQILSTTILGHCPGLIHYVFECEIGPAGQSYWGFAPHHWHEWFNQNWR